MLSWYAKEAGLETKKAYHEHFEWYVTETDDQQGEALVDKLARRGCHDIHVYIENETSAWVIQDTYGKLFRVCQCRFTETLV